MMNWLSLAFTLLLVLDPFGNIPVLAGLLEKVAPQRRRFVILRECLIALVILLVFLVAGPQIMRLLGVGQVSLTVASGVVLMLIALRMLFPGKGGVSGDEESDGEPYIVPIATPLIAGPSAIATVLLLHGSSEDWLINGLVAVGLAWSVTAGLLLLAPELVRLLGKRLMIAGMRLAGLLLTVIAVQMVLNGINLFIQGLKP